MRKVNDNNRFQINDIEGEIWKDVPEYEDSYAVSNYGRIKSKSRLIITPSGKSYPVKTRILSPSFAAKGYPYITFNKHRVKKSYIVHRLVAQLFIPNPDNLPYVDHIDTDPWNCEASNLRWCTASENMKNPDTRAKVKQVYIRNGKKVVQLKDGKIIRIYNYPAEVQAYGFNGSNVSRVCTGMYKQYNGYQWMYLTDYEKQFGPVQLNS